jgi:hypothetical protein
MSLLWRATLLAALATMACASVSAADQDLAKLKGQPVQPVIAKLGPPESQQQTGSGSTYAWTLKTRVNTPTRTTTTDYAAGRPNTSETMTMVPQLLSCTLRLQVDAAGIIGGVEQDGSFQACGAFADKLEGRR